MGAKIEWLQHTDHGRMGCTDRAQAEDAKKRGWVPWDHDGWKAARIAAKAQAAEEPKRGPGRPKKVEPPAEPEA